MALTVLCHILSYTECHVPRLWRLTDCNTAPSTCRDAAGTRCLQPRSLYVTSEGQQQPLQSSGCVLGSVGVGWEVWGWG